MSLSEGPFLNFLARLSAGGTHFAVVHSSHDVQMKNAIFCRRNLVFSQRNLTISVDFLWIPGLTWFCIKQEIKKLRNTVRLSWPPQKIRNLRLSGKLGFLKWQGGCTVLQRTHRISQFPTANGVELRIGKNINMQNMFKSIVFCDDKLHTYVLTRLMGKSRSS